MSGNFTEAQMAAAHADRRVLRSKDKLGGALVALMQEKPFDEITVQQVLDRAGVGRSTFYAHYSDKDDLFLSDVEDFFVILATLLTRRGASVERIAPMREFLAHLVDVRVFYAAMAASGKLQDVLELGQGLIARSIEERLLLARVRMEPSELKVHAHALAGAFFALVSWWVDHGMLVTPETMDARFHRLVWGGLDR